MTNVEEATFFYTKYLETKEEIYLTRLYHSCVDVSKCLALQFLRERGIIYNDDKLKELCHDMTSRFITNFVMRKDYIVLNILAQLRYQMIYFLYDRYGSNKKHEQNEKYDLNENMSVPAEEDKVDYENIINEIQDADFGDEVLLVVFTATSYKKCIVSISKISSKRWVYDRAVELKFLYNKIKEIKQWKTNNLTKEEVRKKEQLSQLIRTRSRSLKLSQRINQKLLD